MGLNQLFVSLKFSGFFRNGFFNGRVKLAGHRAIPNVLFWPRSLKSVKPAISFSRSPGAKTGKSALPPTACAAFSCLFTSGIGSNLRMIKEMEIVISRDDYGFIRVLIFKSRSHGHKIPRVESRDGR